MISLVKLLLLFCEKTDVAPCHPRQGQCPFYAGLLLHLPVLQAETQLSSHRSS